MAAQRGNGMNPEAMKAFGNAVKSALFAKEIRQYTMGQNIGLSPAYINAVTRGEFNPFDAEIERLAEFLGIPLKIVDACKTSPRTPPKTTSIETTRSNVVKIDDYRSK